MKKIGILTSGGDCSGLNAVIRGVVYCATQKGWDVIGIHDATDGIFARPMRYQHLTCADFDFPFAALGGTMLGSNNSGNPKMQYHDDGTVEELTEADLQQRFNEGVAELGLSALIVVGGDGSMAISSKYCKAAGISMIGIPKTIDNDAPGTQSAIGFATAVSVVTDMLDKLTTTATSHHRVMIAEVMGRGAGHLALHAGLAGFADVILIPELPYTYKGVVDRLTKLKEMGKKYGLVVVAEGVKTPTGQQSFAGGGKSLHGISNFFANRLMQDGFDVRANICGHAQRAGTPVSDDRILAARFAKHAVDLIADNKTNAVVVLQNGNVIDMTLDDVLAIGNSPVDTSSDLIAAARELGVYIGE